MVLVTRPGKQGWKLCQLLTQHNIASIHHPLISIQSEPSLSDFGSELYEFDIIIAISQHAVICVQEALINSSFVWPKSAVYFAIGEKTAKILSRVTQKKVYHPSQSGSENLLAMPKLRNVEKKRILILRGNSGRELIFDTLFRRQAIVRYQQTYRRALIPFNSHTQILHWKNNNVDTLVVTSIGQLQFLLSQMKSYRIWLQDLVLFVPSVRIVVEAEKMGFTRVINSSSASNLKIIEAIQMYK
ncbi:uroporphyrinogen-III synthase [Candidatus Photodesmus blepharus]|uniref:Uroporphyrinogen-III synthase n=2 Tax=Candidatus Photodesmus blepharonis TaxID=1179155 RepID=A0A084CNI4_9GAMM|nr:uroporphyrinogen-III synthase [Candidatus Photodesmus blepharus]